MADRIMGQVFRFGGGSRFGNPGLRTDGRPFRAHAPWRVNDGTETASTARAPGYVSPAPTNFAEAFKPRLGGQMKPQFDFSVRSPLPPSTLGATPQFAKNDLPNSIVVPTDTAAAPMVPMFGAVSDAGAEVKNTAQLWTQAKAGGWTVTDPQEQQDIAKRFAPSPVVAATGNTSTLPY